MRVVDFLSSESLDDDIRRVFEELGVSMRDSERLGDGGPVLVFASQGAEIAHELDLKEVEPTRAIAVCSEPAGLPKGCLWLHPETLRSERARLMLKAWLSDSEDDPVQGLLAQISHDMRSPLSVISTAASLIAKFGADQTRTNRYLALINESSGVLKSLVSDILDYSNIRQGEFAFTATDFHLPQLLSSITESFRLLVKQPDLLKVDCSLDDSLPEFVHGDPGRLRQVLTNLMNNALKFTTSGAVGLYASRRGELLCFSVADTGVGIQPAALERIFLPYQQADKNVHANFGGTGLGLTICRALVSRMGGEIGVESELGQGSRFSFTAKLPAVAVKQPGDLPELSGKRIFVASGSPNMIPAWMAERNHLKLAGSPLEAETILAGETFDLSILDLDLGQWDFVRQVAELRKDSPIAVITAVGQRGDVALCKEIGVSGYLTAPLEREELETALALVLSGANQDIVTKYTAKEFLSSQER